jgi:hypothetical protein
MTTTARVRAIALALPDVTSAPHFDREAFKVGGKTFATLDDETVNLRLTVEQQAEALAVLTSAEPCVGAWGRQGWTSIRHSRTKVAELDEWLRDAWRYRATLRILAAHADI